MKSINQLSFTVFQPGEVIVQQAWIVYRTSKVVLINLDLRSKYCETAGTFSSDEDGPGVCLSANDRSLYLDEKKLGTDTIITFPQFKGFTMFAETCCRYTARLVLLKDGIE